MSFWESFILQLKALEKIGMSIFCIGSSVLGRPVFCIKIGDGKKKIIAQYAIHAREHITYHLAILHAKKLFREHPDASVFLIPLANPDGVCLAVDGIASVTDINHDLSISVGHFPFCPDFSAINQLKVNKVRNTLLHTNGSPDFSLWKANANAVDLNVNFDAKWATGKQNVFIQSSANFVGKRANSEPETKVLINFTKVIKPNMTISYHSKGEVIYYRFGQTGRNLKRDKKIAQAVSHETGYRLGHARGSVGGYKDWCIQELNIPALTVEVGADSLTHPVGLEHLPKIWAENRNVITKSLALLEEFNI